MDAHELVSRLKGLAAELGRLPTRDEFVQLDGAGAFKGVFGTWAVFTRAAGFEPVREHRRKIDNSVFERDLPTHLAEYAPKVVVPAGGAQDAYVDTLVIGDTHAPFMNLPLIADITNFAREMQPKVIVQVGDLYDMLSAAKFPKSQNTFTPRVEMETGRAQAEAMWSGLIAAVPGAKCYQLRGNHCIRPLKQVLENFPFGEDWIERMLSEHLSFPGVETIQDHRQELSLPGGILVHHGYRSGLGQHRDYTHTNFICGHSHTGGVVYRQIQGRVLWELNAGLAGLADAKGFHYTPQKTTAWTPGWGWVDRFGPRFIPWNQP